MVHNGCGISKRIELKGGNIMTRTTRTNTYRRKGYAEREREAVIRQKKKTQAQHLAIFFGFCAAVFGMCAAFGYAIAQI